MEQVPPFPTKGSQRARLTLSEARMAVPIRNAEEAAFGDASRKGEEEVPISKRPKSARGKSGSLLVASPHKVSEKNSSKSARGSEAAVESRVATEQEQKKKKKKASNALSSQKEDADPSVANAIAYYSLPPQLKKQSSSPSLKQRAQLLTHEPTPHSSQSFIKRPDTAKMQRVASKDYKLKVEQLGDLSKGIQSYKYQQLPPLRVKPLSSPSKVGELMGPHEDDLRPEAFGSDVYCRAISTYPWDVLAGARAEKKQQAGCGGGESRISDGREDGKIRVRVRASPPRFLFVFLCEV